jgi:hypothetical protein
VNTIPSTLALQYDPTSQTASVYLDGTLEISSKPITLSAPIGSAGIWGYQIGTAGAASFQNFEVSAIATPEPSAYALLVGGCAMLFFISRLKKQVKA